jgi:hypothetical protein
MRSEDSRDKERRGEEREGEKSIPFYIQPIQFRDPRNLLLN